MGMGNDKTTVSISEANKTALDDVSVQVFGNDNATYDQTIGFLAAFYNSNS